MFLVCMDWKSVGKMRGALINCLRALLPARMIAHFIKDVEGVWGTESLFGLFSFFAYIL